MIAGPVTVVLLVVAVPVLVAAVLTAQGRYVRWRTPRLPEARDRPAGLAAGSTPPLRLLVIGESTVAGVGARTHRAGLGARTAGTVARRTGRAVSWRAIGRSGATVRDLRDRIASISGCDGADVVVLAFGVNDTKRLRRTARWTRDLRAMLGTLRALRADVPIVIAGVPPMGCFPALPQPLRWFLGKRAAALDRAARALTADVSGVVYVPAGALSRADFASDGFHPGPRGYARWGEALGSAIVALITHHPVRQSAPSLDPAASLSPSW